jgi:hypothetical protein
MNLHETLTYRRSRAHVVPVAFREVRQTPTIAQFTSSLMAHTRRNLSLLILTAVLGALLLVPAGASAAGCDAGNMIDAAANGRQISTHTMACYKQALAELPSDVDGYAPDVRRNLISAEQRDATLKAKRSNGDSRQLASELAGFSSSAAAPAEVRGPVANLLEGLGPAHVDQVPLPVLALGGAAGLLLLAGLATSLLRVRQRRAARS